MSNESLLTEFAAGYGFPLDRYQVEACRHRVEAGSGVLVASPRDQARRSLRVRTPSGAGAGTKCFEHHPDQGAEHRFTIWLDRVTVPTTWAC
ncbi:MAG: hypothetical protein R2703_06025 [Micropruina glycogenica]